MHAIRQFSFWHVFVFSICSNLCALHMLMVRNHESWAILIFAAVAMLVSFAIGIPLAVKEQGSIPPRFGELKPTLLVTFFATEVTIFIIGSLTAAVMFTAASVLLLAIMRFTPLQAAEAHK